ncbi:hypothetical protein FISHEDRAFT_61779 [Fistulina hepatica ATCC 64428]|uniref:Uncharacterized protein n=1 Tax=Fistulina hepatica ATCC 64428 TaxID=1128425 RepID=A0A0D7A3W7_9AGAR|nr:hypothetical protein FISHEDRAFT_61779 [Fistulina hepatica ATCC 64428]
MSAVTETPISPFQEKSSYDDEKSVEEAVHEVPSSGDGNALNFDCHAGVEAFILATVDIYCAMKISDCFSTVQLPMVSVQHRVRGSVFSWALLHLSQAATSVEDLPQAKERGRHRPRPPHDKRSAARSRHVLEQLNDEIN